MSISSVASSPPQAVATAPRTATSAAVNDHDADDLQGAVATAAPKAAPPAGTGQAVDKLA